MRGVTRRSRRTRPWHTITRRDRHPIRPLKPSPGTGRAGERSEPGGAGCQHDRRRDVIAVLGKTEGNGCVNDFARAGLLTARFGTSRAEVEARIQFIMSGGTTTPHVSVFARREVSADQGPGKGLVAGIASTRPLEPEELGTVTHVREFALAVAHAMADAGVADRPASTSSRSSARC